MTVVPIPDAVTSSVEPCQMRRFASRISASTRSGPPAGSTSSRSAAAARREATSPAWWPPIPSATAKSGGSRT